MADTQTEQTSRYDVVIYNIETREIAAMAGKGMRRDTGHLNAEKRLATVLGQGLNDSYSAAIVLTGKYERGSILDENDCS